jgi:hypothetical protein
MGARGRLRITVSSRPGEQQSEGVTGLRATHQLGATHKLCMTHLLSINQISVGGLTANEYALESVPLC